VRILDGSVVPPNMVIPSFSVVAGRPARVVGEIAEGELDGMDLREVYRGVVIALWWEGRTRVGRGRVCLSTAYWRVWSMEKGEEGRRYDTHFRNSKHQHTSCFEA
jgi:hypothetical protein